MAGKGSRQRPLSVTRSTFGDNWDAIFSKPKSDNPEMDRAIQQIYSSDQFTIEAAHTAFVSNSTDLGDSNE